MVFQFKSKSLLKHIEVSRVKFAKAGVVGKTLKKYQLTNVQKLDVPGPDEKFCLCWLCAFTKFSSGGAIFPVHLIFEHL